MKKNKIFLIIAVLGFAVSACSYDFVIDEELPTNGGEPIEISFSGDILPIFSSRGCTACHEPGKQTPDLTSANAYQSINKPRYIDLNNPESSLLYSFISPESSGHVWKHYKAVEAQKVLLWIQQGAKEN